MPEITVVDVQTSFTAGEFSPLLYGNVDLKKARNGAKRLQNVIVMPQGGITRAPGTIFCAEAKVNTNVIIVPFQFSLVQSYLVEMGEEYFRFFKDEGQIFSGGVPYEVANTYLDDEIYQCGFFQSADVLYITHGNHIPAKLTRTAHTAWTLTDTEILDGPYMNVNSTVTTIAPSGTTGSITLTSSTDLFVATDVGRLVRILHGSTWGYCKITAFTDLRHVTALVKNNFGGTTATVTWRLGCFSETTGYPKVAMCHDERLYYACTEAQPDGLWGSVVREYGDFKPTLIDGTVTDDCAVYGILSSDQVNAINWLISTNKGIMLGTITNEWTLTPGSSTDSVITPASKSAKPRTNIGSARFVRPVKINNVVLFLQYMKKKVYELVYKFENDDYAAVDLSIMSWHLIEAGVRAITYQQEPFGIVWMNTEDDRLIGMTYLRDQDVVALYERVLGGVDAAVKWCAVIPSRYIEYSQLWLVVKRTIEGVTKQYIEYADKIFNTTDLTDKSDAYFVDCGFKYNDVPINSLVGIDHLKGETVQVLADGTDIGDFAVSATGTLTLSEEAAKINLGFGTEVDVQLLPIESQGIFGTVQGHIKRVHEAVLRLYQSDLSAIAYYDENNQDKMDSWRD